MPGWEVYASANGKLYLGDAAQISSVRQSEATGSHASLQAPEPVATPVATEPVLVQEHVTILPAVEQVVEAKPSQPVRFAVCAVKNGKQSAADNHGV